MSDFTLLKKDFAAAGTTGWTVLFLAGMVSDSWAEFFALCLLGVVSYAMLLIASIIVGLLPDRLILPLGLFSVLVVVFAVLVEIL